MIHAFRYVSHTMPFNYDLRAPDFLAAQVAKKSISAGDKQSYVSKFIFLN